MKHALLGASLGWIAAAMWSDSLWFAAFASVVSLVYLVLALSWGRQKYTVWPSQLCDSDPHTIVGTWESKEDGTK